MNGTLSIIQNFLGGLGRAQFFLLSILAAIPSTVMRPRLIVQQLYAVGSMSLIIIVIFSVYENFVSRIEAVDQDAVRRVARRLLRGELTLAALGPIDGLESLDKIAGRLAA